jgi:hypothetical protein
MHTRFQMTLVAATITALYSPDASLAKQRAHLKAHAVHFVRGRPNSFGRRDILGGASPSQTCHYFGGNGLPVQVCW